jgi:hypothetical protein
MAIWSCSRLSEFVDDLTELKADRVIKSKHRLLTLAINNLDLSEKKKDKILGKRTKEDQE